MTKFTVPPQYGNIGHRGVDYQVDENHEIEIEHIDAALVAELAVIGVVPAPEREKVAPPPDPAAAEAKELDDLREKLEALGVTPDKRWKADRLRKEIEEAEAAKKKDA